MIQGLNLVRLDHLIIKIFNNLVVDLPGPKNISYWWNYGVCLALFLGVQLITGILLSMCYICDVNVAFSCVDSIIRDVNYGWVVRNLHANGASFFFFVYIFIWVEVYIIIHFILWSYD